MTKRAMIGCYIFLVIMVIIEIFPLLYTVSGAFKTNKEIASGSINLIPKNPTFDNIQMKLLE